MQMKSLIGFVLFACWALSVHAFNRDSTYVDRDRVYKSVTYFIDRDYNFDSATKDTIDNSLDFFHQYNPVLNHQIFYKYLGNLGAAYQSMVYTNPQTFGFNSGLFDYDLYQTQSSSIKYYDAKKKYTDLRYVLGSKLEQKFIITHTQNINKYINVGFDFQRISSDAYFKNFNAEYTNASIFTNIHSKNNRYRLLSNVITNKLDVGQNGGLVRDSVIEFTKNVDNLFYRTNLGDARTKSSARSVYLKQSFDFGFQYEKKVNDTSSTKVFKPSVGIFHSILYEDKGYAYKEETVPGNYYPAIYYDSLQTRDSIYIRKIENKVSIFTLDNSKRNPEGSRKVNLFLLADNQIVLYKQRLLDTLLNNTYLKAAVYSNLNKFKWDVNGSYSIFGANKNDYLLNGLFKYELAHKKSNLQLSASNQKRSPAFIYNRFDSNHFIWSNKFNTAALSSVAISYHSPKYHFDIEFGYSFLKNYLYFGLDTLPKQQFHTFKINTISLHKDVRFSRFVFANNIVYQKANVDVIRLPKLVSNHSFYYENKFFNRNLLAQIGFDLRYTSAYYSDGYLPATGQFFLQNNRIVGNRPYIDIFINFQIKTARIFLKMEHINAPSSGFDSNMVPIYPIPGMAFKFGISWHFFD